LSEKYLDWQKTTWT